MDIRFNVNRHTWGVLLRTWRYLRQRRNGKGEDTTIGDALDWMARQADLDLVYLTKGCKKRRKR